MCQVLEKVFEFKKRYPGTMVWRLAKHAKVVDGYLNPGEVVLYAFCGQKNNDWYDISSSCVIAITNKRILVGQKRILWGSRFSQITPDMYNDMQVYRGLFFGKITIDTVKEVLVLSNLSKHSLDEIETNISEYIMREKQKYRNN